MSPAERKSARAGLVRELDALAAQASRSIRSYRRRGAFSRAIDSALPFAVAIPLLWIFADQAGLLGDLPRALVLPATLAAPMLYLAARVLFAGGSEVTRHDALAVLDSELELEDRLLSAAEFIEAGLESPFVDAALEDARSVCGRARAAQPRLSHREWSPTGTSWGIGIVSVALLFVALILGPPVTLPSPQPSVVGEPESLALLEVQDGSNEALTPLAQVEHPEKQESSVAPAALHSDAIRRDQAGKLSDHTKESEGKTGEGRSSDAEASSSSSESRGQPSAQSQMSKASLKPPQKPTKRAKPKTPTAFDAILKRREEDDSGSTAGRGASKGSSRNPAVSKWSSKDQVTHTDDQEIEDDEETEDEEEDQESRGGIQPNLRDRKPPVSRDLRIGFGNQKNPDANSRGGASESKKSRGTASLVLGVPIPDRVKGQPSPGKTKITQERIEPKPEDDAALDADRRKQRADPTGFIEERELTPWMRTLVREYFLTLRKRTDRS